MSDDDGLEYPYALDRLTERAFLLELEATLAVMLWRADEIEECALEYRRQGTIQSVTGLGWRSGTVDGGTRLFGSIEGFLSGWARASLILFPTKGSAARGKHLRSAVGLRDDWPYNSIKDRGLRNGWMHLDEDLDVWSASREGAVGPGELSPKHADAYAHAVAGAIRVLSLDRLVVLLPMRGAWSLSPLFNEVKLLHEKVERVVESEDRWIQHRGIEGLAAGWGGIPKQTWKVRSLV